MILKLKEWFQLFKELSFLEKLDYIAFFSLCALIFDCAITGGGHYLSVFGITPRLAFGGVAIIASLPKIFSSKEKIFNPIVISVICFAAYLLICAYRGFINGNNTEILVSDIRGFMWIALFPVFIATVSCHKRVSDILSVAMVGGAILGFLVLFINILCSCTESFFGLIYHPANDSLLGTVSGVAPNIYRIFLRSSPYLIVSCAVAIAKQMSFDHIRWRYVLIIAVCLNALLLTFTRSLYACVAIAAILIIISMLWIYPQKIKHLLKTIAFSVVGFLVIVLVQQVAFQANYIEFAFIRTFLSSMYTDNSIDVSPDNFALNDPYAQYMLDTQAADGLRQQTVKELVQIFRENIVFGSGLGASAPCRESIGGFDEYFILDTLCRTGLLGLFLFFFPFIVILYNILVKHKIVRNPMFDFVWPIVASLIALFFVSWYHQWMNAVLGLAWYAFAAVIPFNLRTFACAEDSSAYANEGCS